MRALHQTAAGQALVARTHEVLLLIAEWRTLDVVTPSMNAAAARCGDVLLMVARSLETGIALSVEQPLPAMDEQFWEASPRAALLLGLDHSTS